MAIKLVDVHNRDQGRFQNGKFDTLPKNGNTLYYQQLISNFKSMVKN